MELNDVAAHPKLPEKVVLGSRYKALQNNGHYERESEKRESYAMECWRGHFRFILSFTHLRLLMYPGVQEITAGLVFFSNIVEF